MKFTTALTLLALSGVCCGSVRANAAPFQADTAKPAPAPAEKPNAALDPAKDKAIRHLLEMTGVGKLAVQAMQQMVASLRQTQSDVPDEFWSSFLSKAKPEELVDLIVPIYAKHYTTEDINGLIAFYQTPLGQKMLTSLPAIMQESNAVGEKWGRAKGEEVMRELEKRSAPAKTTPAAKPKPKSSGKTKG